MKEELERRVVALRSEYEKRAAKLGQAWQLTKDAFAA